MKVVIINDFTTCSEIALGIQMPIIRDAGMECYPVPSKLLSFPLCNEGAVSMRTDKFAIDFLESIEASDEKIDAVLTGFIPDAVLMDKVYDFVVNQKRKGAMIIIDPVMGDNGSAYKSVTKEYENSVKKLVSLADVALPNATESILLTGVEYKDDFSKSEIEKILCSMKNMGIKMPVVTGAKVDGKDCIAYFVNDKLALSEYERVGGAVSGTGDRFAAELTVGMLRDGDLGGAINIAKEAVTKHEKMRDCSSR